MTGQQRSSADLDPRRRKLLFRCWHRGLREMDLILGRFADAEITGLSEVEIAEFEWLIDAPDPELFAWLTGAKDTPDTYDTAVFRKLRQFHSYAGPIHI